MSSSLLAISPSVCACATVHTGCGLVQPSPTDRQVGKMPFGQTKCHKPKCATFVSGLNQCALLECEVMAPPHVASLKNVFSLDKRPVEGSSQTTNWRLLKGRWSFVHILVCGILCVGLGCEHDARVRYPRIAPEER